MYVCMYVCMYTYIHLHTIEVLHDLWVVVIVVVVVAVLNIVKITNFIVSNLQIHDTQMRNADRNRQQPIRMYYVCMYACMHVCMAMGKNSTTYSSPSSALSSHSTHTPRRGNPLSYSWTRSAPSTRLICLCCRGCTPSSWTPEPVS